jgi:peptide/nickel transport system ATP-binding protein
MLKINNLSVNYDSNDGTVEAVDEVDIELDKGENLGIVGESGCGKSTLAKAILGVLPSNGYVESGTIEFQETDLVSISDREQREYKWEEISMIPQSAMNALDPVYTIREQIIEAIDIHRPKEPNPDEIVDEMFKLVGLDPDRADQYPHQFSGGMRQRAMIAMSLALDPALILADEPTTALDVIMQDQILKRISSIQDDIDSSMLIITHDVAVVAETCDRVAVMYAGEIVEKGTVEQIFGEAYHPYTIGLQNAFPDIDKPDQDLISISGYPPKLVDPPTGCRFASRCPMATEKCEHESPPLEQVDQINEDHWSACHHLDRLDTDLRPKAEQAETWNMEVNQ